MPAMASSFVKRRWKLLVNLVTLVALIALVYFSREQLGETIGDLANITIWVLLLIIPIKMLNFHVQAKMYQDLFRIIGRETSYRFMLRASLELNFVNLVFPSGGAAGISYFGLRMRRANSITGAQATLVQIIKLILTFLSFEVLIIFGLLALASQGSVNGLLMLVAATFSTLLLVSNFIFVYIAGSQRRINTSFVFVTRVLNRAVRLVRPKSPETINIEAAKRVFDDFHDNYRYLQRNWRRLRGPFIYALLYNVTEVAALYVIFLSFGNAVNIGAIILAYAVANFAGLVSVLPGGVGIYEALMVSVLGSAGVPPGISLPATIMFRVVSTILQVPPGYYFYTKAIKEGAQPPETEHVRST